MSIHEREVAGHAQRTHRRGARVDRLRDSTDSQEPGGATSLAPSMSGDIFAHVSRVGGWSRKYTTRLIALDVLAAVLAVGIALALGPDRSDVTMRYVVASLGMPLAWIVALALSRAYERRYLGVSDEEYRAVGRAVVGLLGVLAVVGMFSKAQWSRLYVLLLIALLFTLSVMVRRGMRWWLHSRRRRGQLMQRTVVVGRADAAAELIRNIKSSPDQGMEVVAVCSSGMDGEWNSASSIEDVPVMGSPLTAVSAVDLCDAEIVVVTSHPELQGKQLRRLAWAMEDRGVELVVSTGLLDVAGPRLSLRQSTDMSLLHIERPAATRRSVLLKSLMDRTLALGLILVLAPVFLAIALGIKLTSPGDIIFRQKRVGVRGELFTIYKFRTMIPGAENKLESLLHLSEGNAVQFKMKQDPRITPIGNFLRKYSLDELPQLFNVLFGTMSLVGPRPQSQAEVEQYEPDALRRLHVRPGMTGLWQISGRSDLDWEQSIRLDLRYVDNWSPIVDLQILFRTFRAVVAGSGAY